MTPDEVVKWDESEGVNPKNEDAMDFTKDELMKIMDLVGGFQKGIQELKDEIRCLAKEVTLLKKQCRATHGGLRVLTNEAKKEGKGN